MIVVASGWLVVLWAAEDGADLREHAPFDGLAPELAIGGSTLILQANPGPLFLDLSDANGMSFRLMATPQT
jgi:hypothetical protein